MSSAAAAAAAVELSSSANAVEFAASLPAHRTAIAIGSSELVAGNATNSAVAATSITPNGDDTGNGNDNGNCLSLALMQSSPPPHSYRHSRAYRHFKNPPQPHMCIRTTTEAGEELFINVLSWTRIVIPQEPSDPIPLYGGMRVPPGSPRSPPIVFAVMANPEVLKDSGRHSKDPEERRAMVELMCDFVEAMNPGVKLVRNAVILKDRDISGELKDVWNAVQAQRDREREEQIMQQRQQQHYHNITTQQMFPRSSEVMRPSQQPKPECDTIKSTAENGCGTVQITGSETSVGADPAPSNAEQQMDNRNVSGNMQIQQELLVAAAGASGGGGGAERLCINSINKNNIKCAEDAIEKILNGGDKALSSVGCGKVDSEQAQNLSDSKDQIDASNRLTAKDELSAVCAKTPTKTNTNTSDTTAQIAKHKHSPSSTKSPTSPTAAAVAAVGLSITNAAVNTAASTTATGPAPVVAPAPAPAPTPVPAPTKKDKLVGFLPNGCIFPRFKNNKHKEKDKDKEKEVKSKDKEKTLLNALKKSKDKKVAPIEQNDKTSPDADAKSQYEKNCINLESEVEKLDLNKIETTAGADNMFIKLKVAATSAVAK